MPLPLSGIDLDDLARGAHPSNPSCRRWPDGHTDRSAEDGGAPTAIAMAWLEFRVLWPMVGRSTGGT